MCRCLVCCTLGFGTDGGFLATDIGFGDVAGKPARRAAQVAVVLCWTDRQKVR